MHLIYRGSTYQPQASSIKLTASQQTGKYRSQTVNFSPSVRVIRQSLVALTYRGVSYIRYTDNRPLTNSKVKL